MADPVSDPLSAAVDILARRGVLAVIRHLATGPATFRTLERQVGLRPASVLQQRLQDLRHLGAVEVDESGDYRLSAEGRRLLGALGRLEEWSRDWTARTPRSLRPRGSLDAAVDEPH